MINLEENKFLIEDISNTDQKELQSLIIKFVCYFNLFECFISEKNIPHWFKFHERFYVDESILDDCFKFFKNRYITDGSTNKDFEDLCKNVDKKYRNELERNLRQGKNKLHVLLSISYYFRNNLYHGHKALCQLKDYTNCFKKISNFIYDIMKNAREKNNG